MGETTSNTGSALFSLLARPDDTNARERFIGLYGPKILGWCKSRGIQTADAQDITQQLLLKFIEIAPEFTKHPKKKFRSWLKAVTNNAVTDLFRKNSAFNQLQDLAAVEDLKKSLDQVAERELLMVAVDKVKMEFTDRTWNAFYMTVLEERSLEEVVSELQMTTSALYMAKSRVRKRLKEEIERLGGDYETTTHKGR